MKKTVLMIAGLFCMQFIMAQWSINLSHPGDAVLNAPDDSFMLSPDTLWFLTSNDFAEGKRFHIINPHNYSLDVQHIDQWGAPCPNCLSWYTVPNNFVYPVTIPANDSLSILVKFIITDYAATAYVYDSLNVSTAGHAGHVIIAADSSHLLIGVAEPGTEKVMATPNPFKDRLKIHLGITHETWANVMIYNALLQPVRELFNGKISVPENSFIWDGTDRYGIEMSPGVYLITIRTVSGLKTLKVVKI